MAKTHPRLASRLKRRTRIRKHVHGTAAQPRLTVFRSAKHIYAQIIDDVAGQTLASASSLGIEKSGNREQAAEVGKLIGEAAKAAGIETVAFDRNGFRYHGRVKALADAARETGLKF